MSLKPHCRPLCTDIGTTASPCVETKPSSGFATEWFIPLLGRDLKNGPVPPPASSTRKDLQGDAVEWLGHALYGICTLTTQRHTFVRSLMCGPTLTYPHPYTAYTYALVHKHLHTVHTCTFAHLHLSMMYTPTFIHTSIHSAHLSLVHHACLTLVHAQV